MVQVGCLSVHGLDKAFEPPNRVLFRATLFGATLFPDKMAPESSSLSAKIGSQTRAAVEVVEATLMAEDAAGPEWERPPSKAEAEAPSVTKQSDAVRRPNLYFSHYLLYLSVVSHSRCCLASDYGFELYIKQSLSLTSSRFVVVVVVVDWIVKEGSEVS